MTGLKPATWYYYRFQLRDRHQPGRPDPHRPGRRRDARTTCASAWCPAPTGRPATSRRTAASPSATTCTRSCTSATTSTSTRPASTATASGDVDIRQHEPGARDRLAGRLPAAARAVQDRPRPAGPAREVPLDHHVGRPRGHQRPVAPTARRTTSRQRGRLPRRAGRARTARTTSGCRSGWTGPPGCGDGDRLFRRLRFGRLAEVSMLDLRSYRSKQVADRRSRRRCRPPRPRSATRRAPSPASSRCSGSRTRWTGSARSGR